MKLHDFLNARIADFAILNAKFHRFHWFFEGEGFFAFHEKFEELYNEASELFDEFAERLLAIGGKPIATLKEFLAHAKLTDEGTETRLPEIGKTVLKDFGIVVDELKSGISIAQDAGDEATADLFIETIQKFEKHAWMIRQSVA